MADNYSDLRDRQAPSVGWLHEAVRRIVAEIQRSRVTPPPVTTRVVGADIDLPSFAIEEDVQTIVDDMLGDDTKGAPFASRDATPIFSALYERFARAFPAPKLMRVDDEASYKRFRDSRRSPYLADLEARVAKLEAEVADHVSDDHGHGRLARLEAALAAHVADHEDVVGYEYAKTCAILGGEPVKVSLPPWMEDKVQCWRNGNEICCTYNVLDNKGKLCFVTSGTPYDEHVEGTIRYATAAGIHPVDVAEVFHDIVPVVGVSSLMPELSRAVPELLKLGHPAPFVAEVRSQGDPELAAAMYLQQEYDKGHPTAIGEIERLRKHHRGKKLFTKAVEQLRQARKGVR